MFSSIVDDIKSAFSYGHMVTKIMIINTAVFVILALIQVFTKNLGVYDPIISNLAMPTKAIDALYKPWTLITYMFVHEGFWHLVWNMVGLNIFGKIVGDLLNDRKVFPLYLLGGIAGALLLLLIAPLMTHIGYGNMRGASAGVLAIAMAGAMVAPDYNIRLLLIGNVRLKYIVMFFIIFDLIGSQGNNNAGGHIGHLGGIMMGALFVYLLRNGRDLSIPINDGLDWISGLVETKSKAKSHRPVLKVEHRSDRLRPKVSTSPELDEDFDATLDNILEKIKVKGYNKLTAAEKDFLTKASQK